MKLNLILLILLAGVFMVLLLAFLLSRWMIRWMDRRTLLYQSDLLQKHCEEVQNMKAYLAMGRLEELSHFLGELDRDLTTVDTVIKTGNVMIDAILNSKISLAKVRGIHVEAKAIVPKELNLSLSEVDLSLVIGNLMDNAMEACDGICDEKERFIRIYMDVLKGQLYIYIMNSAEGRRKRAGRVYESTKDGKYHGFGLMRIDKVVDKYQGYLERQDEEGVFVTEVMLPL